MSTSALATDSTMHRTNTASSLTAAVRIGVVLIATGLAFVVLALDAPSVLAWVYQLAAVSGTDTTITDGTRFGAALFGALTLGWGVTILQLGRGRALASAIAAGTVAWFVVDSTGSVLTGYAGNVLINVAFAGTVFLLLRLGKR